MPCWLTACSPQHGTKLTGVADLEFAVHGSTQCIPPNQIWLSVGYFMSLVLALRPRDRLRSYIPILYILPPTGPMAVTNFDRRVENLGNGMD